MRILFASLLLLLVVDVAVQPVFTISLPSPGNTLESTGNSKKDVIVKLAVFFDTEFGNIFQHDTNMILKYLQAAFYDVHLRFQTIQDYQVSFQVTYLRTFKNADEQHFIEKEKNVNGTFSFLPNVLFSFQRWVYEEMENLPEFDIALTLLGTDQVDDNELGGVATSYTACQGMDYKARHWKSALVLMMRSITPATLLAHELAHILGARHDDDPPPSNNICEATKNRNNYIMESDPTTATKPYFFSKCSQHWINRTLSSISGDNFCFKPTVHKVNPILDSEKLLHDSSKVGALSMEEQCQILVNDTTAFVSTQDENCWFVKCRQNSTKEPKYFQPFDGTFCKNGTGRCFRGECFPLYKPTIQLENVAVSKCLASRDNIFSPSDPAVIINCSTEQLAPLVITKAKRGFKLLMGYSTEDGARDKCLTVVDKVFVKFEPCLDYLKFEWEFRKVEASKSAMVLYHTLSKTCVKTNEKGIVLKATTDCSGNKDVSLWKLADPKQNIGNVDSSAVITKPFATIVCLVIWLLLNF